MELYDSIQILFSLLKIVSASNKVKVETVRDSLIATIN